MYIIGLGGTHPTSDKKPLSLYFFSQYSLPILPSRFCSSQAEGDAVTVCLNCNLTERQMCHIPHRGASWLWAPGDPLDGGFHTDFS